MCFCCKRDFRMVIAIVKVRQRNLKGVLRNSNFRFCIGVFVKSKDSSDAGAVGFNEL